jgi:hypothetical protein
MAQSTLTRRRAMASTAWVCRLPWALFAVVVGLRGWAALDAKTTRSRTSSSCSAGELDHRVLEHRDTASAYLRCGSGSKVRLSWRRAGFLGRSGGADGRTDPRRSFSNSSRRTDRSIRSSVTPA